VKAPQIEATASGWVIRDKGKIRADVAAPPDAFLCRLTPGGNPDVVQLSIGRVKSTLCDSLYSPVQDEAITFVGTDVVLTPAGPQYVLAAQGPLTITRIPDFMKTQRDLKHFQPLDTVDFPRAPAGWCSWYIYGQSTTEQEVVQNSDWLAKNLKPFGCDYVQIDDGWQGRGSGSGTNRDWAVTCPARFPSGMKSIADKIRQDGFKPGIWLIPFTQSSPEFYKKYHDMCVLDDDGRSVGEIKKPLTPEMENDDSTYQWIGKYVIDPTGTEGQDYLKGLFRTICDDWGYDYVKIDGEGGMAGLYEQNRARLANPALHGDEAYRLGLAAMKDVMGKKRFLLNCGGAWDSAGYCEGIRIGGDVSDSVEGMQHAIDATMQHLFINHIGWWTDPDVVCVRPPLTLEQARTWATLLGITGQLLMASDDMPALAPDRVELLKRIFPVADIRPMDLYALNSKPRIFDLRISKPGVGDWDVVALFNWDTATPAQVRLDPADLGLPAGDYLYYDVWNKSLAGAGAGAIPFSLGPLSCQVLAVRPAADHPQLLGTSRHLTQGADDLLQARWDGKIMSWSGKSQVVGGDPYEIRFSLPPGWACATPSAHVDGPVAVLTLKSVASQSMPWKIAFKKTRGASSAPVVRNARLAVVNRAVSLTWDGENAIAYRVYRNNALLTQTGDTSFVDPVEKHGVPYQYEVSAMGWKGESPRVPAGEATIPALPRGHAPDIDLDKMPGISSVQDYGSLQIDKTVDRNPLRLGGVTFAHGLGTHANSVIRISVNNRYQRFEAEVGVDDEKAGGGTVVFQVFGDGVKLYDSGVMKGKEPAKNVSVSLDGVEALRLVVTDAGDGINSDHADWANARLIGNP
jgi:hypothetical protein